VSALHAQETGLPVGSKAPTTTLVETLDGKPFDSDPNDHSIGLAAEPSRFVNSSVCRRPPTDACTMLTWSS
jgi:hypothetical protein